MTKITETIEQIAERRQQRRAELLVDRADLGPVFPRKVTRGDLERVNLGRAWWSAETGVIQDEEVRGLVTKYKSNIAQVMKTGSGLLIYGHPGVGKTSAAACLLKQAISSGFETYFITHTGLKELRFEKIPSQFGNSASGMTVKRKIETVPFLVVDGFNESFFTDNVYGPHQLEELLTQRVGNKLTTVMTIRSVKTLKSESSSDLFDLIRQCMAPVEITGKDMRSRMTIIQDDK